MDEIESMAKELCRKNGENPYVRKREYGQSCWDYWAWEEYREEAREAIERARRAKDAD